MGWNLFSNKKDEEKSLLDKIESSLKRKKEEKRNVLKEIDEIKEWAANAIIDSYAEFFPNSHLTYYRKKYTETALKNYEKIRTDFGKQMAIEEVEKCDRIIQSYLEQIRLREEKLALFDKLISEYEESKEKLKQARFQENEHTKLQNKEERLKTHAHRLKTLEERSDKELSKIEKESYELEDVKQEVVYHQEYHKELHRLNKQFKKDKSLEKKIIEEEDNNRIKKTKTNKNKANFTDEIENMLNDLG